MTTETLLTRTNGDKHKIIVVFWADSIRNEFKYRCKVEYLPKGKRKWVHVVPESHVTELELQQAKLDLWAQLKP